MSSYTDRTRDRILEDHVHWLAAVGVSHLLMMGVQAVTGVSLSSNRPVGRPSMLRTFFSRQ